MDGQTLISDMISTGKCPEELGASIFPFTYDERSRRLFRDSEKMIWNIHVHSLGANLPESFSVWPHSGWKTSGHFAFSHPVSCLAFRCMSESKLESRLAILRAEPCTQVGASKKMKA